MFKRILIKVSGEALMNSNSCSEFAGTIKELSDMQVKICIVIGGGNLMRGSSRGTLPRVVADQIGMLSTVINAMILKEELLKIDCKTEVLSAINCRQVVKTYKWQKALSYLDDGFVVIFAGGTGNPYFSTDSAAALRASEMGAEILFKATKVSGVFDKDPLKNRDAAPFKQISYSEYLSKQLKIIDLSAIVLCMENKIPVRIFNLLEKGALKKAVLKESVGTLISGE